MEDNLSLKSIVRRVKSESSPFFKKLGLLGVAIGGAGAAILALPVSLAAAGVVVALPTVLTTIATHCVVIGVATKALSTLSAPAIGSESVKKEEDGKQ